MKTRLCQLNKADGKHPEIPETTLKLNDTSSCICPNKEASLTPGTCISSCGCFLPDLTRFATLQCGETRQFVNFVIRTTVHDSRNCRQNPCQIGSEAFPNPDISGRNSTHPVSFAFSIMPRWQYFKSVASLMPDGVPQLNANAPAISNDNPSISVNQMKSRSCLKRRNSPGERGERESCFRSRGVGACRRAIA